jgi:hypothetical protein
MRSCRAVVRFPVRVGDSLVRRGDLLLGRDYRLRLIDATTWTFTGDRPTVIRHVTGDTLSVLMLNVFGHNVPFGVAGGNRAGCRNVRALAC